MAKYRKKPVEVDVFTFEEFIEIGKKWSENKGYKLIDSMPWVFEYNGYRVTHENNTRYLIATLEGVMDFTSDDVLIVGVEGEIYPCKKGIFDKTYEKAD